MSQQFVRIWGNTTEARQLRALNALTRYRENAARAGYKIKEGGKASNVQIPRRVYMGLSNG